MSRDKVKTSTKASHIPFSGAQGNGGGSTCREMELDVETKVASMERSAEVIPIVAGPFNLNLGSNLALGAKTDNFNLGQLFLRLLLGDRWMPREEEAKRGYLDLMNNVKGAPKYLRLSSDSKEFIKDRVSSGSQGSMEELVKFVEQDLMHLDPQMRARSGNAADHFRNFQQNVFQVTTRPEISEKDLDKSSMKALVKYLSLVKNYSDAIGQFEKNLKEDLPEMGPLIRYGNMLKYPEGFHKGREIASKMKHVEISSFIYPHQVGSGKRLTDVLKIWDPLDSDVLDSVHQSLIDNNDERVIQKAFCHLRTKDYHSIDFQNIQHKEIVYEIDGEMRMGQGIGGWFQGSAGWFQSSAGYFKSFGDALEYLLENWENIPGSIKGIHRNDLFEVPRFFVKSGRKVEADKHNTLWVLKKKDLKKGGSLRSDSKKNRLRREAVTLRTELLTHLRENYQFEGEKFEKDIKAIANHFGKRERGVISFECVLEAMLNRRNCAPTDASMIPVPSDAAVETTVSIADGPVVVREGEPSTILPDNFWFDRYEVLSNIIIADNSKDVSEESLITRKVIDLIVPNGDEDLKFANGSVLAMVLNFHCSYFREDLREYMMSEKFLNEKTANMQSRSLSPSDNHEAHPLYMALRGKFDAELCMRLLDLAPDTAAIPCGGHGDLPVHQLFSRANSVYCGQMRSEKNNCRVSEEAHATYALFVKLLKCYDDVEVKKGKIDKSTTSGKTLSDGKTVIYGTGGVDIPDHRGYCLIHILADSILGTDGRGDEHYVDCLNDICMLYPDGLTKMTPDYGNTALGVALYRCENEGLIKALIKKEKERVAALIDKEKEMETAATLTSLDYVCTVDYIGCTYMQVFLSCPGRFPKDEIFDLLLSDYPENLREAHSHGCAVTNGKSFPLHDAIRTECSFEMIEKIYNFFPQAMEELDDEGLQPFELRYGQEVLGLVKDVDGDERFIAKFKQKFDELNAKREAQRAKEAEVEEEMKEIYENLKLEPGIEQYDHGSDVITSRSESWRAGMVSRERSYLSLPRAKSECDLASEISEMSESDAARSPRKEHQGGVSHGIPKRTGICRVFRDNGSCVHGDSCRYALLTSPSCRITKYHIDRSYPNYIP